jgi:drug/metabolite transporter (DMT)-like permease
VITRPGTESFDSGMWLALGAAASNTAYFLITRVLSRHDAPETTHLFTGFVGALASIPLAFPVWQTPTSVDTWLVIGLISIAGASCHYLLILAHKYAPASVLSPFFYTQLLFAALIGAVVFGSLPDRWTVLGGSIVIGSGLYLLYRERVRHHTPSVDVAV